MSANAIRRDNPDATAFDAADARALRDGRVPPRLGPLIATPPERLGEGAEGARFADDLAHLGPGDTCRAAVFERDTLILGTPERTYLVSVPDGRIYAVYRGGPPPR